MTPPPLSRCACGRIKRADRDRCCCQCAAGQHNTACAIRQLASDPVPRLAVTRGGVV
jgi:hypothetical protein